MSLFYQTHILPRDTDTSDPACSPSPLCRLYIESYLNSQLFSWLNKRGTSYSKGIRLLLESYIAILLFWSLLTSHLPTDKSLRVSLYTGAFMLLLNRNPLCNLYPGMSLLCRSYLVFHLGLILSLLWQTPGEVNDDKKSTSGFAPDFRDRSHLLAMLWLLIFLLQSHPDSTGTGKSRGRQQGISFKLGYTRMGTVHENAKRTEIG